MRGRFLAGFILALAAITAWAGAIPFAQSAPVAIAYTGTQPQVAPQTALQSPQPALAALPRVQDGPAPGRPDARLDWRSLIAPRATVKPADPTPVPLATPVPQDEPTDGPAATPGPDATATPRPTDAPDPTDRPDPTATPRVTPAPTDAPDPTASPTPKPTASPTPKPTASPTPKPTASPTPKPTASPTPKPTASPTPKPTASPTPRPTASPTPAPTAPPQANYTGRSHFWFPALNIDTDWGWYGCDYGGPDALPGGIWRWGCGPQNNIYLLSHAWSTFKKIKTAYHNGTLQVGQNVWWSNAQGDVTKFEIRWIRRVTAEYLNATASEWALNDSPTPIMTLQTCDGADDQFRIIVRLVPAN
jgi:hypothetical protein